MDFDIFKQNLTEQKKIALARCKKLIQKYEFFIQALDFKHADETKQELTQIKKDNELTAADIADLIDKYKVEQYMHKTTIVRRIQN